MPNKIATGSERAKKRISSVFTGFSFTPDWLKNSRFAVIGWSMLEKFMSHQFLFYDNCRNSRALIG